MALRILVTVVAIITAAISLSPVVAFRIAHMRTSNEVVADDVMRRSVGTSIANEKWFWSSYAVNVTDCLGNALSMTSTDGKLDKQSGHFEVTADLGGKRYRAPSYHMEWFDASDWRYFDHDGPGERQGLGFRDRMAFEGDLCNGASDLWLRQGGFGGGDQALIQIPKVQCPLVTGRVNVEVSLDIFDTGFVRTVLMMGGIEFKFRVHVGARKRSIVCVWGEIKKKR